MSTKITRTTTCIDTENKTTITAKGAVEVCNEANKENVLARKKQYSIVGDALYLTINTDDPPAWLENLIADITSDQYTTFESLIGGIQSSFLSAVSEIQLARNAYTNALNVMQSVDGIVLSHLTGLNASLDDAFSQIVNLQSVITTNQMAVSNITQQLSSEIGLARAGITTSRGTIAVLRRDHEALSEYTNDQLYLLSEAMAYEFAILRASNDELLSTITNLETVLVDQLGAMATKWDAIEITDENNNSTTASIDDFNVVITTEGTDGKSTAGSGKSVISSDASSSTIDMLRLRAEAGIYTAETVRVDWVASGSLVPIKNAMATKISDLRAIANSITGTDDGSIELKKAYTKQADALQLRLDFIEQNDTIMANPSHGNGHFGAYFGEYHTTLKSNGELVTSGYHFLNDGNSGDAYFNVDKAYFGRPDNNGVYPAAVIGSDFVFNDLKYRKADVVVMPTTGSQDIVNATTGKTYLFRNSSNVNINFTYSNPPQGARIDILTGDDGSVTVDNPPISGNKTVDGHSGASFIFANNIWYSIGTT